MRGFSRDILRIMPDVPPHAACASRPERLCFGESGISPLRFLEHGRDARLLTARQAAGGECLPGAPATPLAVGIRAFDEPLRQFLVHRDVVEVAARPAASRDSLRNPAG